MSPFSFEEEELEHLRRTLRSIASASDAMYSSKTDGYKMSRSAELRYLKSIYEACIGWLDIIGKPTDVVNSITEILKKGIGMADGKYGRIFTESDVEKILSLIDGIDTDDGLPGLLERLEEGGESPLTFPVEEPLFVLRAKDSRALGTVRAYLDHQKRPGDVDHFDSIEKAIRTFEQFRADYPDRMGEPD